VRLGRDADDPPHLGRAIVLRAGLAAILVIALSATAVATTVILEVDRVKEIFTAKGRQTVEIPEVTRAEAGGPRTLLLLGSDERYADKVAGRKSRSDTILLVRVDPRVDGISVLSIPRDLKAQIPGHGADKINAAYEDGGPRLTVRTIKKLFEGVTGKPFPINNVLVASFGSFTKAVDYIHGVYVDVDRRYFNDNASGIDDYATIDIQPGYQKLMGKDALDYVRYRHTDNDIVRAARQQDFLRQARNAAGVRKLLSIGNRDRLARAFSRYFQFDRSILDTREIFSLLKLGLFLVQRHPAVQQIKFPFYEASNPALDTRLYVHRAQLRKAINQFMDVKPAPAPAPSGGSPAERRPGGGGAGKAKLDLSAIPGLVDARTEGEDQAVLAQRDLTFPFYFPARRYQGSTYAGDARVYTIRDETGTRHEAYRLVLATGVAGEYYGVEGMTWTDPPLLDDPDQIRVVGGRRLQIYRDGRQIRIVAWRTPKAVYWVSNTLTQSLTPKQMLGIAASLTKLKG
jgi:LCP family protein required for cell wall assembly